MADTRVKLTGSMRMADGRRVALSSEECEALMAQVRAQDEDRKARLPDDRACLVAMHDGYERLRQLGWRDIIYCPKDGSVFDSISAGSTGIHPCHYEGTWPDGRWWVEDGGDLWPAQPILFRLRATDAGPRASRRCAPCPCLTGEDQ